MPFLLFCGAAVRVAVAADPFALAGTQPFELQIPLEPVENCELCHAGFENAPFDTWSGTMMANAFRDPLFLAALTIAEQDVPTAGGFCLRCHVPNGWLEGRCLPGDGSRLTGDDIDAGVGCDSCHRMFDEGLTGNAQYSVHDSPAKVGTIGTNPATHGVVQDEFLASGDMCGVCHEVSNPALNDFPIELTWTEWAASDFKEDGITCQDCHMKEARGIIANTSGAPDRDVNVHRFVGSNAWIPQVLAQEYPELGREEAYAAVTADAKALHKEAADVTIEFPPGMSAGSAVLFNVRVENNTGHKLPTGYPEGRRAWLEVEVQDANGKQLLSSGAYDTQTAILTKDNQLRAYQALLGTGGVQSFHMVKQDTLLEDTRIPPRGFIPLPHTTPVGRSYAENADGTLVNYDRAPYVLYLPAEAASPITVRSTLWYQTTTRDYVTFLRDENQTNELGDEMYRMWEAYGKAPPDEISTDTQTIEITPAVLFDPPPDDIRRMQSECNGCATGSSPAWWIGGLALFVVGVSRRHRAVRKPAHRL